MEWLVKIGGFYNILLVVFHLSFWQLFNWETDLRKLSFINRAVMQVINLSLTFVFIIFAYISLVHTNELLSSALGQSLLSLMAAFWFLRSIEQVIFFKLKSRLSFAFLLFFLIGTVLYAIPALYGH